MELLDLEADVFDYISGKVTEEYPDTHFTTEYNPTPPSFPAVSIREADNREANRYRTAEGERASAVMFEVAVYSNKVGNKRSESREIAVAVDDAMRSIGFTRRSKNNVPNYNDATIERIVMRYEGTIIPNDDGKFYVHYQ